MGSAGDDKGWAIWAWLIEGCGAVGQDVPRFVSIETMSCHVRVSEPIEGVTVSSFNGIQPRLLDQEANTHMVEANKGANAGEVKCSRVIGNTGCLGCHGHRLGHFPQEHDQDVLPGGASSPEALAGVRQKC